jgi:hypothetical protein
VKLLLFVLHAVLEHFASEEPSEDLLDLDGGLDLALVFPANTNAELVVAASQVLFVDIDGQLA